MNLVDEHDVFVTGPQLRVYPYLDPLVGLVLGYYNLLPVSVQLRLDDATARNLNFIASFWTP